MVEEEGYPVRLKASMERAGTSRRRLSRDFAALTGNLPSSEWRALGKYLSGAELPTPDRAQVIAELLDDPGLVVVTPRRRARQAELEGRVAELEDALNRLGPAVEKLARRVSVLERRAPPRKRSA